MPCLVSLAGKDSDFQSLSWATWATESQMETEKRISVALKFDGVATAYQFQLLILLTGAE